MNPGKILFIASLITAFLIPPTIILAKHFGLVDDPRKRPHPAHTHTKIIPRAGGLPIYLGIIFASLIFLPLEKYLLGIFSGLTILLIIGLIDDKVKTFNPYLRLGLLAVAALMPVGAGIGISFITNPFQGLTFLPSVFRDQVIHLDQIVITIDTHRIILLADLFALIWIIALTQIINWSKGVDGQMPGITLIASIVLGALSLKFYGQGDIGQANIAKLAFITAGSSLGFLIFNWHPAKILPGFSGSTILAFMLATLSILSGAKVATAILVLAVPTADFIYTIIRRILSGKSPVWGDRGHLHHRLLDLGWSHQKISLFYILGSAMLGAIALLVDTNSKMFVAAVVAAVFLGFILWLNSFGDLSRPQGRDNG